MELVDEPAECVAPLLTGYRDVLEGRREGRDLWEWMMQVRDASSSACCLAACRVAYVVSFYRGAHERTGALC